MITLIDYRRITERIVHNALMGKLHQLEQKLHLSSIIDSKQVPADLVTMNSQVLFELVDSEEIIQSRLVYELDSDKGKISIFSPIGGALLGMRVGETKVYQDERGKFIQLKLNKILFQPEAFGHFEL